jgi:ribonuclease P protein component
MVLFGIPKSREEVNRLGVTVTRRIGCAVVRSRCKRRLRELFRQRFTAQKHAFDLVINAKHGCIRASWSELVVEFDRAVREMQRRAG